MRTEQAFMIPHFVNIKEHKLLNELFTIYGWI